MGETTVKDYIQRSKLTGAGRNGIAGSPEHFDYLAAVHELTIFWQFLDRDTYMDRTKFADPVKLVMLSCQIYNFFLRRWCLPRCFENLFNTFNQQHTEQLGIRNQAQIRKTLELLVVGYFCGIVFMPGAN